VIAVDTNILVYSHRPESEFFERATDSIRSLAESPDHWAIPWPCWRALAEILAQGKIVGPKVHDARNRRHLPCTWSRGVVPPLQPNTGCEGHKPGTAGIVFSVADPGTPQMGAVSK
jgi:predicted nucleic acid-binding protein